MFALIVSRATLGQSKAPTKCAGWVDGVDPPTYLPNMDYSPKLRVARPTDNLDALLHFYRDGLGMSVLYHFEDHDGFDGVMLGWKGAPYHLEFTRAHDPQAGRAPTEDNLLVFYIPDAREWEAATLRMQAAGFSPVTSFNPYWDRNGRTFEDPDGYRVVIQNDQWDA